MQSRISDVDKAIIEDRKKLSVLESDYNTHLIANNDEKADKIFPEIEKLKMRLKGHAHKIKSLEELRSENLKKLAIVAALEAKEVREDFVNRSKPFLDDIEKAKEKYIAACRKAVQFNNEFLNVMDGYQALLRESKVDRKDIGNAEHAQIERPSLVIPQNFDLKGVPFNG